jgi:hypothetical protein
MPSKSRRLPGGKVRRPPSRARPVSAPPEAAEVAGPEVPPNGTALEQAPDSDLGPDLEGQPPAGVAAPVAVAAGAVAVGAAGATTAPRRRGAVTTRSTAGRQARRSGPTSLDQAEATLTYVRTDLARILILAAVMIGIIVVLAFVLR